MLYIFNLIFRVRDYVNSSKLLLAQVLVLSAVILFVNNMLYIFDLKYEKGIEKDFIENESKYITSLVKSDLNNIINNKFSEHILLIKNFSDVSSDNTYENVYIHSIYNKNDKKIIIDFTNITEFIEKLSVNKFNFSISINDKVLSKSDSNENYEIINSETVSNIKFTLKTSPLENSLFYLNSKYRVYKRVLSRIFLSLALVGFMIFILFKRHKSVKMSKFLGENLSELKEWYAHEKMYTINCYEYSKKDQELIERMNEAGLVEGNNNNYFPLFLIRHIDENIIHTFDVNKLALNKIINGHNIVHQSSILLFEHNHTSSNKISSFIGEEIFIQLIESVVRNFLYFKSKSEKNAQIRISYFDNEIAIECDLVRLTTDMLIKWSKDIFYKTGDPYILDFEKIFKIYELYNANIQILHNNENLILKLEFKTESVKSTIPEIITNVIDITDKFKRK